VYPYDHSQIPAGASPPVQDFSAPRAPYHTEDARRQSFGGITSQHNYTAQTLPSRGMYTQELKAPATSYNEFGGSRRSLGYMEHIQEKQHTIPYTPSKRKSKFGLATLLGRKSQVYDRDLLASQDSPVSRRSTSDARDDVTYNGSFATSGSRHSVTPRMSVISRKVEALVEQVHISFRPGALPSLLLTLLRIFIRILRSLLTGTRRAINRQWIYYGDSVQLAACSRLSYKWVLCHIVFIAFSFSFATCFSSSGNCI
jgi:hypothetical protein